MNKVRLIPVLSAFLPLLAGACPERVPAGLKPTVVGEGVRVDSMNLSILMVEGAEPAAAVLDRVERTWREEGFDVKRNRAGSWNIVSALGERCLATLQLADSGKAKGFFAVNPLKPVAVRAPLAPPGARVLSSVSSREDDGRRGTIAALVSSQPVEALRAFYMRRLQDDNWSSVRADAAPRSGRENAMVVSAQRGRERIEVVLWRDMETHIVVNQAESL
ncbi:hypothetical protein [Massilia sp. Leaf139]|uniref:hypothetical protein n=1 Tax=Massilia sp. Leaf139 TaxID=1736272 RepID=UPI00070049ED|nr:hypothetical protein [Massilia sp. Leaf139]KQQ91779.1 hypothetical protein ASF77_07560 [Massilia sp. Leaf139]